MRTCRSARGRAAKRSTRRRRGCRFPGQAEPLRTPGRHALAPASVCGRDVEGEGGDGGGDQLRGPAVVEVQQATQAFTTDHRRVVVGRRRGRRRRREQSVLEALMVALEVVVLDEFGDGQAKMPLPKQHELVKALGLDRQDKSLGVRIGASCRVHRKGSDRRDVFG